MAVLPLGPFYLSLGIHPNCLALTFQTSESRIPCSWEDHFWSISSLPSLFAVMWRVFSRSVGSELHGSLVAAGGPAMKVVKYAKSVSVAHWSMAALFGGVVGTVKAAQWTKDEAKKARYMHIHKSLALLVIAALPIRIGLRLTTRLPGALPGAHKIELLAGKLGHYALYGTMVALPTTGVTMGYFGGKGLPFFAFHIPGASQPLPEVAKAAFKAHKTLGQAFTYLIPLHIAGASWHVLRGHPVFQRMNPFV